MSPSEPPDTADFSPDRLPKDPQTLDLARYNQEAIQEILQLALARRSDIGGDIDGYSRSQLLEMGQELGLSAADITAAEQTWQEVYGDQGDRVRFQESEKQRIQRRIMKLAIITGFLMPMNWVLSQQLGWSLLIALTWGLLITLDAWKSQQTDTDAFAKRFRNWQDDQRTLDDWT